MTSPRRRPCLLALTALLLLAAAPRDWAPRLEEARDALDSARALLARGDSKTADRRLREADRLYRTILTEDPNQRDAALGLSSSLFLQKRFDDGVSLIRPFHERLPDDLDITHQLGLHLYRAGERQTALPLLERAAADPSRFDASWLLVQYYYQVANWPAALTYAERYRTARPDDLESLALIGTVYLKAGAFDQAADALSRYLQAFPNTTDAEINYANALFRRGDLTQAATVYERLLARSPDRPRFLYNLATVRIKQGRCADAVDLLTDFLKREPQNGPGLYFRADCLLKLGRLDEAERAFVDAQTRTGGNNPWLFYGLSRLALLRNDLPAATAHARRAHELAAGDSSLTSWLGTVLRRAGDPAAALPFHDRALTQVSPPTDPARASILVERAHDLWALDRLAPARDAFSEALTLAPTLLPARAGLVALETARGAGAWAQGDPTAAAQAFTAALSLDPNAAQARANLALLRFATGVPTEARALLQAAPAETATAPDLLAARAFIALADAQFDEALALSTRARAEGSTLRAPLAAVAGYLAARAAAWPAAVTAFDEALALARTPDLERARAQCLLELGLDALRRGDGPTARDALARAAQVATLLVPEDRTTLEFAQTALGLITATDPQGGAATLSAALASPRFRGPAWDRVRDLGQGFVAYGWLRAGRTTEARQALARVRDRAALGPAWDALNAQIDERDARLAFTAAQFPRAATLWSALNAKTPTDPIVIHNLAAARFMLGDLDAAIAAWRPLLDASTPPEAAYNLGNALLRRADYRAAFDLFRRFSQSAAPNAALGRDRAQRLNRLFGFTSGANP